MERRAAIDGVVRTLGRSQMCRAVMASKAGGREWQLPRYLRHRFAVAANVGRCAAL